MNHSLLRNMGRLGAAVASSALLAGGLALESGAMEPGFPDLATAAVKPAFERLDADRDGEVTPVEARATWLAAVFHNVDVDRDGAVDRAEYDAALS